MHFEQSLIYHVYNQGNNSQSIFFERENYLFFLRKMRKHLLPYADVLCYCLMPNHFHWLLVPKESGILEGTVPKPINKSQMADISKMADILEKSKTDDQMSATSEVSAIKDTTKQKRLNQEIATLLSSYTKAINKKYGRKGSLFRSKTKAKNGWIEEFVTINSRHQDLIFKPDNDYAWQCFHYIHDNPVKAGLVDKATDWEFSSAKDYAAIRKGTLCNYQLSKKIFPAS